MSAEKNALPQSEKLPRAFFETSPLECARALVGKEFRWGKAGGLVVETEAYSEIGDEACHTFSRPSARSFLDEHAAGAAYVYLNYGMYWLTNVLVSDPVGRERGFVLLRALQPLQGLQAMRRRRDRSEDRDLCSGPGKLSMALAIEGPKAHGLDLADASDLRRGFFQPSKMAEEAFMDGGQIVADGRIGISKAQDLPWRFCLAGSEHLSAKPQN